MDYRQNNWGQGKTPDTENASIVTGMRAMHVDVPPKTQITTSMQLTRRRFSRIMF